ncbi:hypothetical protein [Methanosalsum zhilinae]|uniref:hypothetical protein n=1 Tax=Methanosalsum zhilinae TaxID=39669 RepID=UPI0006622314|nr:hypothetical protein [Methanosalsum zhilinae]
MWSRIIVALRDSTCQKGKFSLEAVCVDSSFIETKKREREQLTMDIKREKGIKVYVCVTCEDFPLAIII